MPDAVRAPVACLPGVPFASVAALRRWTGDDKNLDYSIKSMVDYGVRQIIGVDSSVVEGILVLIWMG